jgi:hypothetical protein
VRRLAAAFQNGGMQAQAFSWQQIHSFQRSLKSESKLSHSKDRKIVD